MYAGTASTVGGAVAGPVGSVVGSVVDKIFGGGKTPPGLPLPWGSVTGEPFAVQVTRIPTDVLQRAAAAGLNPFDMTKQLATSGITVMEEELQRRANGTSQPAPPANATVPVTPGSGGVPGSPNQVGSGQLLSANVAGVPLPLIALGLFLWFNGRRGRR